MLDLNVFIYVFLGSPTNTVDQISKGGIKFYDFIKYNNTIECLIIFN